MRERGGGGGERERERENTLLHKDKDLSTSRLFYQSVPADKLNNTQYVKQGKRKERESSLAE